MNYVIAIIGIGILIYDGFLASKGKMTISQKCQKLAPPAIDWGIGIGGWIAINVVKYYWPAFNFTLATAIILLWGHVWISNKERYES